MKKYLYSILFFLLIFTSCSNLDESNKAEVEVRETKLFNDHWKFKRVEAEAEWKNITLPHTLKIEPLVVNDQWQGVAWYEKEFDYTPTEKLVFIKFEGIMHEADVWLNDKHLITHQGGYLPFSIDLTSDLKKGNNIIKVKVNNMDNPIIPPGKPLQYLDFNYYGGIYRDVKLITTNKTHITDAVMASKVASGGTMVHFSNITDTSANCFIKVHVSNTAAIEKPLSLRVILKDKEGKTTEQKFDNFKVLADSSNEININTIVTNPLIWSTKTPNLYELTIELFSNNEKIDQIRQKVGIRQIELTKEGFFLNGQHNFIRGTNRHQEYPFVGYALSNQAQYRDAVKIKEAGFDFVRLSHYPQNEAFLDACDELGILVMDAIPGWQFFEEGAFTDNSFQDIRDMVRRDRNHPSIIFWEVSLNESGMTNDYMIQANKILKEELPFADTYSVGWIDHEAFDLYIPARQHSKAPDYWTNYEKENRKIFISEYGDWEYYAHNAGFNQKDFKGLKEEERTSRQLREFGEKRLLQQSLNYQEAANSNRQGQNTIGHANWLMFDYNRGYSADIESSGISDIFRLPKFAFYFYQSQRPPLEKIEFRDKVIGGPMVKIASYWDNNSQLDIRVFSNCDEVALFLNDSLVSKTKPLRNQYSSHLKYPPFTFSIKEFISGTLVAKGFINGKIVCEDHVSTPETPEKLKLVIDKSSVELDQNEPDLLIMHALVLDKNETVNPADSSLIYFTVVKGEAELIGENPTRAKAGIASILLKTSILSEELIINASSKSLKMDEIEVLH